MLANDAVDLELRRGEVHCLLGENGAGKSTLMNVIFGLYQPDAGELAVDGEPVRFRSSADAIASGIGMVHQHFQLVQAFSVAENVVLGDELRRGPLLDLDAARERIATLSADWGVPVDPDAKVEDLSVGQQQRVELLKALFRDASILILDEPTAVLTPGEVDEFFGVVREPHRPGQVDHLHHAQAARGPGGGRPHHGAPAGQGGRVRRSGRGHAGLVGVADGGPRGPAVDRQGAGAADGRDAAGP